MTTVEPILKVEDIDYKRIEKNETPAALPPTGAITSHRALIGRPTNGNCRPQLVTSRIEEG